MQKPCKVQLIEKLKNNYVNVNMCLKLDYENRP